MLYGLHSNAEIGFLTAKATDLFKTVLELMPKTAAGSESGGATIEEKVREKSGLCLFGC